MDIFRDQLAIAHPGLGHALQDPRPGDGFPPAEIGDVGYVVRGHFLRIFNALLPGNHPSQLFGVPENYEPLQLHERNHIDSETLPPSNFCSHGIIGVPEVADSGPPEVPFSCTREHGAVMSLPTTSRREDTRLQLDFSKWIITHIDSWFAYTSDLGMGVEMEEMILVTGCHRTRTWFNVTCNGQPHERLWTSLHAEAAGDSGANHKRQDFILYTPGLSVDYGTGSEEPVDHCVIIRGFRMKRIFFGTLPWARGTATPQPDPP